MHSRLWETRILQAGFQRLLPLSCPFIQFIQVQRLAKANLLSSLLKIPETMFFS